MGTDTSLAVLSDRPRLLYDYFKQLFAQVTNPPLDAHPRGAGDVDGDRRIGPEGNLLEPAPEACRQIKLKTPDPRQRRAGEAAPRRPARLQVDHAADALHASPRAARAWRRRMEELCRRASEAVDDGLQRSHPVGPRRGSRARADPGAAGDRGRAPSSDPRGHARKVGLVIEIGRGARGASLRAAPRLRRRRDQSVPRLRDARRHDPPGHAAGARSQDGGQELHQGAQQGRPQGHVEDGHLDDPELPRRADLRGDRPRRRPSSTATSPGPPRASAASASTWSREEVLARHHRAFPERPVGEPELDWGGEYQWRRDGEYHLFNPDTVFKLQHATRSEAVRDLQGVHGARRRAERAPGDAARACFDLQAGRRSRSRSTRSSRSRPSSSASPPARCPTARSARRRTRRSPSP